MQKLGGGGVATFLLLFSSFTFTERGESKVPFNTFWILSVELAMQGSPPSLCCTKTFYHLYISDPLW